MREVIDELCSDMTLGKALRIRETLKGYDMRTMKRLAVFLMAYVIFAFAMFGILVAGAYFSGEPLHADEMEHTATGLAMLGGGLVMGMMLAYQSLSDNVKRKIREPIENAIEELSDTVNPSDSGTETGIETN